MYENKSVKSEQSKSVSKRNDSANKHTSNKSKETSSCNSCGVCNRLRNPHLSAESISSALSYAKAVGKESCALSFMQSNYGNRFTASILNLAIQKKATLCHSEIVSESQGLNPTILKKCSCGGSCPRCIGEEEAERISMSVMKMESPVLSKKASIDYKPSSEKNEQGLISEIMSNKGSGQRLDDNTRSFMEERFGCDFSPIRVHTGSYAAIKSRELNAEAFTIGRDVFFNAGRYNPSSTDGKKLLVHELTHVVQQAGGLQGRLTVGQAGDRSEQEADRVTKQVMNMSESQIQHQPKEKEKKEIQTKPEVVQLALPAIITAMGAAEWIAVGVAGYMVAGDAITSASGDVSYSFDEMEGVLLPGGGNDVSAYRAQHPNTQINEATHFLAVWFGWEGSRKMGIKFGITFLYDGNALGNISLSIIDTYDWPGWGGNVNVNITPRSLSAGRASVRFTINMGTSNSWFNPDETGSAVFILRADGDLSRTTWGRGVYHEIG